MSIVFIHASILVSFYFSSDQSSKAMFILLLFHLSVWYFNGALAIDEIQQQVQQEIKGHASQLITDQPQPQRKIYKIVNDIVDRFRILNDQTDGFFDEIVRLHEERLVNLIDHLHEQFSASDGFVARLDYAVRPQSVLNQRQVMKNLTVNGKTFYNTIIGSPTFLRNKLNDGYEKTAKLAHDLRSKINMVNNKAVPQLVFIDRDSHLRGTTEIHLQKAWISSKTTLVNHLPYHTSFFDDIIYDQQFGLNHYINSTIYYTNPLSVHRVFTTRVNGLKLPQDAVIRSSKDQKVMSPLRITHLTCYRLETSRSNLNFRDIIFIADSQRTSFNNPLHFKSPVYVTYNLSVPTISNVDLRVFQSSVLTYDLNQNISKPMTFRSMSAPTVDLRDKLNGFAFDMVIDRLIQTNKEYRLSSLTLSNAFVHNFHVLSLNGKRFLEDYLRSSVRKLQIIPIPLNIERATFTRGTNFNGSINGLRYPDSFVTLDGRETVYSNLNFLNRVAFNKKVVTNSYIGKHRVMNLINWVHGFDLVTKKIRNYPTGHVNIHGDLYVAGAVNRLRLNHMLLSDLVHLSESKVIQVRGSKTFTSPVQASSISIGLINNLPMTVFTKVTDRPQLSSPIRFEHPVVINDLHWRATGGRNRMFDLFYKLISLVNSELIEGDMYFDQMSASQLFVDATKGYRLNNISPSQFVLPYAPQYISGLKTFFSSKFVKPIIAPNITINQSVNSRNIHKILKDALKPLGRSLLFNQVTLRNSVTNRLSSNSSDKWSLINGQPIVRFLRNLLLKDGDQTISNRKKFLHHVSFGSKISSRSSRGALYGTHKGPLFLHSAITLNEKTRLIRLIIHGNLEVKGKVNKIDFSKRLINLQQNWNNQFHIMTNSQSFYKGLTARLIRVKYLNGQLFEKYWSVRRLPQFSAPIEVDRLRIDGQVQLYGLLNSLPIEKVVSQLMRQQLYQTMIIHGNVVFKSPIHIKNNLNVSGTINSVPFGSLMKNLDNLNLNVTTDFLILNSLTVKGNLQAIRFNGTPLKDLLSSIFLIHPTKLSYLAYPVEFISPVSVAENISQINVVNKFNSYVNGVNLRNLINTMQRSNVVTNLVQFADSVVVSSPIAITGLVNDLDLKRDVIWLRDYFEPYQLITGRKMFVRAHFMSDLDIRGTFNGENWPSRLRNTLSPTADQNISSYYKFDRKVIISSRLFTIMINSIPLTSFVATSLRGIIEIPKEWIFDGPVTIKRDLLIDGRIKNVSLTMLSHFSLRKDIPQIINTPIHFNHVVLNSLAPVTSLIRKEEAIENLYKDYLNQNIIAKIDTLNRQVIQNYRNYSQISRYLKARPVEIKEFTVFQRFPGIVGSTIDLHSNHSFSIGSMDGENVVFNHFAFNGSQFTFNGKPVNTSYVSSHTLILHGKVYSLLQASSNSSNPSILIDSNRRTIGSLTGRSYDDLKILSLNSREKIISALSSVRGVIETFGLDLVNDEPNLRLINTLAVTPTARKISLFAVMKGIYLAVARSSDIECDTETSSSLLFYWMDYQFKLIQRFNKFEASNVIHYVYNNNSYLVFSNNKGKADRFNDKSIHIYQSIYNKWPECQFKHFHSINFEHTVDLQSFAVQSTPWSVQLLAALNSSSLTIWEQKGNAGFTQIWSQSLNEGQAFKFFTINQRFYIVVAQMNRRMGTLVFASV